MSSHAGLPAPPFPINCHLLRSRRDLSKMTGGTPQYHISPLSRPPDLWIFNKVQRRKRTEAQPSSSSAASVVGGAGEAYELLEVVAIVQGDISVVRSFEEVVGARLVSPAWHHGRPEWGMADHWAFFLLIFAWGAAAPTTLGRRACSFSHSNPDFSAFTLSSRSTTPSHAHSRPSDPAPRRPPCDS